jgi:hypothetical protein
MQINKKLRHSKKAIALGVALLNLNLIFILSPLFKVQLELATHMITAILTLVALYIGAEGGVDMIQSSKLNTLFAEEEPTCTPTPTPTPTVACTPCASPTPTPISSVISTPTPEAVIVPVIEPKKRKKHLDPPV